MLKIKVELQRGSYPIFIGYNLLSKAEEIFKFYDFNGKILLITTPDIEKSYRSYIQGCLKFYRGRVYIKSITKPKQNRNLKNIDEILAFLLRNQFNQQSAIISFGGKAIHDIAGFAASVFHEGIAYVQIPTSLLAQLNSTVVPRFFLDFAHKYSFISSEIIPSFVWSDLSLIKSLNIKDYKVGLLEAIRVGIIGDETLFSFIEHNLINLFRQDIKSLLFLVHKVCALKSELYSRNQPSQGIPRILNFGKTIERILLNSTREWNINPIEAQFLGILIESILANRYDILNQEDYQRIETILFKLSLDISIDKIDFDKLHRYIQETNDCPEHFTFPKRIGESVFMKRKAI